MARVPGGHMEGCGAGIDDVSDVVPLAGRYLAVVNTERQALVFHDCPGNGPQLPAKCGQVLQGGARHATVVGSTKMKPCPLISSP